MQNILQRGTALWLIAIIALLAITPLPHLAHSQDPQRIESNDPAVTRSGTWTSQAATDASGGSYLYNSPSPKIGEGSGVGTVLQLEFSGPSIEVLYVAGPSLGTLAINVDDTVLRTVITTAETTAYQQSARIDYLSDETHILKVYAQAGGVVAIDAFVIPTPSPSPMLGEGNADGESRETYCAPTNAIHRVSLTSTGGQANAETYLNLTGPKLSSNGRYVVFGSRAHLVPIDNDTHFDIYLYDRKTCTIQLVSMSAQGIKANSTSYTVSISGDGRYIVFDSEANNLISNDTNNNADIFLYDQQTHTTTRVSLASGGTEANGSSYWPSISDDGRYISFHSDATNLVVGDSNGEIDVFVYDRQTNTTSRVSVATDGTEANEQSGDCYISANGRFVVFASLASNLVAEAGNYVSNVFVHDMISGVTSAISLATDGTLAGYMSEHPAISADGRFVAFESGAANLVEGDTNQALDVFVHDRQTAAITRVSVASDSTPADGSSFTPSISADGRYVVFSSGATNLVSNDTNNFSDIFVFDRQTAATSRISYAFNGAQATGGETGFPTISGDGRYISFFSRATNLVIGDTNGFMDVFVTPRIQPSPDSLALFNPPFQFVALLSTLTDNPPASAYTAFSAYAPVNNGQWVMGDWNGDGLDTASLYLNGVFYFTNVSGESRPADWGGFWIGINGPPVAGRFSNAANDCIGTVDGVPIGGVTIFALYYTCDMSGTSATPPLSFQWLSAPLPDPTFTGTFQFSAGDFNGDGLDSIAVRRNEFIAYGNVNPAAGPAIFDLAQYIGAPGQGDNGLFVVGDWDGSGADSFGLFYQNGELFYRNDLDFNSGVYLNQSIGAPFGSAGVQVATWR